MATISKKTQGVFCILASACSFSIMTVFVKLAGDLPAVQKAFFRNFVSLLFISVMLLRKKVSPIPPKAHVPDLLARAFFGTVGLLCNYYSIGELSLADANMLNKLSPFFAILFSVFLLGEKPSLMQVGGVCVAFLGSICIIKPSLDNPAMFPAVAGMISGMSAGLAYTFVRRLSLKNEDSRRIVFWFSAFSCLLCLPFLLFSYVEMSGRQWLYLLLAGTFACTGQLSITRAYLCAPAKEISVYDYTQVLFAAVLGYFVFGDMPDAYSFLGYALICGAGITMFFYGKQKQ